MTVAWKLAALAWLSVGLAAGLFGPHAGLAQSATDPSAGVLDTVLEPQSGTAAGPKRITPLSFTVVPFARTEAPLLNHRPGPVGRTTTEGVLLDLLVESGFENPRVRIAGDSLLLAFEYRMGRGTHAGVCRALALAGSSFDHVTAVLEHQEAPMAAVTFRGPTLASQHGCAGYAPTGATLNVRRATRRLDAGQQARSRGIDISIHPKYSALFGFYRDPVMLQLNAAPQVHLRLWKGFEIGAQVVIPFYNEFSNEGNYVRPGLVTASQFARLPGPTFVRLTAGTFTNRRFGVDLRARRFFADGRFSAGVELSRTGNVFFPNGSVFIDQAPEWVALGTLGVVWPRYNLFVDASAGQFLFGDLGGRLEIIRQFGPTDIGFVFAQTVNGANAGLRVVLPLLEGFSVGSQSLRVRPAPDFTWDYMYRAGANVGEYYDTGYYVDRAFRQHQPDYLLDLFRRP